MAIALCLLGTLYFGCDWARFENTSCPDPILCYLDSDDDGIGRDANPIWACKEDIPTGYVSIGGDMCENSNAINWDGIQFEGCQYEIPGCAPIEWQGVVYQVTNISGTCYFAQDLKVESTNEGQPIQEVTSLGNYSDLGYFKNIEDPTRGYLYGADLIYPEDLLCPPGWHVWEYNEAIASIWRVQQYTTISKGLKGNGSWREAAGNYWGFNAVPTGIFDRNFGYVNEGNIAAYFTVEPNHIYNLNVLEGDQVGVESHWLTWTASSARGKLRAVRCAK